MTSNIDPQESVPASGAGGVPPAEPSTPLAPPSAGAPARSAEEERISVASQWQLMWWRFRRHKLAMIASVVILFFYFVVVFADFFAYSDPYASDAQRTLLPPQSIQLFDQSGFNPHVCGFVGRRDPETFRRLYVADCSTRYEVRPFSQGYIYKLFGLIETDRHLLGINPLTVLGTDGAPTGDVVVTEEALFILGADVQGRDQWSRLIYATRTSLLIGLLGVTLSLFLGVLLGGISGFYGGVADTIIQRLVELLRSLPVIPLWMGLAAAMPQDWDILQIYFAITLIISLIGWTELGRVVRGRFLGLRHEDFVMAAELVGCRTRRIIFVHMVPLFLSHIIAATTLALPAMVISETALSFLGIGLRPPALSWGVLLQQAQNIQTVAQSGWLMAPAIPVVIVILAFNFLGDGLRDAADPYGV